MFQREGTQRLRWDRLSYEDHFWEPGDTHWACSRWTRTSAEHSWAWCTQWRSSDPTLHLKTKENEMLRSSLETRWRRVRMQGEGFRRMTVVKTSKTDEEVQKGRGRGPSGSAGNERQRETQPQQLIWQRRWSGRSQWLKGSRCGAAQVIGSRCAGRCGDRVMFEGETHWGEGSVKRGI